jgi:isopentenyl-diphosphate delta-isomerase type 1
MELMDVLDENGNKTGIVKEKNEIYKEGLWHNAVHIWIINDNMELLVQKRNPKKETYPNLWAISVAGHVRAGETSLIAGKRELKEELGQVVEDNALQFLFRIKRIDENTNLNVFDDVYLVKLNLDVEQTKLQYSEVTDIKYIYFEYLKQILENNDKDYVPIALENKKLFSYLEGISV